MHYKFTHVAVAGMALLLLSGCSYYHHQQQASADGARPQNTRWQFVAFWQPVHIRAAVTEQLLGLEADAVSVALDAPSSHRQDYLQIPQQRLRSRAYQQMPVFAAKLERALQGELLGAGLVGEIPPDEVSSLWVEYHFTRFEPTFRSFKPWEFFKNLWNPLPGAAVLATFPVRGGEYIAFIRVLDCSQRLLMELEISGHGTDAAVQMARQLQAALLQVSWRLPSACIPKHFFMGQRSRAESI